jgi:hypothetical protein
MNQDIKKSKRNLRWWMRYLHNKTGFFIVALVIIYSLSGLLQTYRDTNLLKHDVAHTVMLAQNLPVAQLGNKLKIRDFKVIKTEGNLIYFKDGTYNKASGVANYATKEWYSWVMPFTELHKSPSNGIAHYFTTMFGIALFFMSISAFWMFKPGTKLFSSGVYITIAGVFAAVILLIIS